MGREDGSRRRSRSGDTPKRGRHGRRLLHVLVAAVLAATLLATMAPATPVGAAGPLSLVSAASGCFIDAAGVPTIALGWIFADSTPGARITSVSFELDSPASVNTNGVQVPGGTLSEQIAVPPAFAAPGASVVVSIRMQTATPGGQTVTGYGSWTERNLQVTDSAGNSLRVPDNDPALLAAAFPLKLADTTQAAANCSPGAPPAAITPVSTPASTATPALVPTATPIPRSAPAPTVTPTATTHSTTARPTPTDTPTAGSITIDEPTPSATPRATATPRPAKRATVKPLLVVHPLIQPVRVGAVETLSVLCAPRALLRLTADYPYPGGRHVVTETHADSRGRAQPSSAYRSPAP